MKKFYEAVGELLFPFFYLLICTRKFLQILKNQSNGQISEELDYI